MTIGMRFKLARIASHMNQRQAAHQAGVTQNYLSLVENDRREPSLRLLERLARVYQQRLILDLQPLSVSVTSSTVEIGKEA